jgi:hypothetical protein
MTRRVDWPEGRRFAFTIVDDTDHATAARIRPIYTLLARLGLFITKTVWVLPAPEDPRWGEGETLADPDYRELVVELQKSGFEIALHGVRGTSSTRAQIEDGLARYRAVLGGPPRIHVNHSRNADNLYWGGARLPRWRRVLHLHRGAPASSSGHDPDSTYFWADLCARSVDYVRALSFSGLDTLARDPYMPYHDARFPLVKAWFSCSDAGDISAFRRLMTPTRISSLAQEGGAAIVYTHFGAPGFLDDNGEVAPAVREALERVASLRGGWFRPASEVLDHLRGGLLRVLSPLQRARLESRARVERWFSR